MRPGWTTSPWAALSMGVAAWVLGATALAVPPCPYSQPLGLIGQAQSVGNYAIGIDVEGQHAFVGDWHQGSHHAYAGVLQTFDVTDPCNPTRLPGWIETTQPGYNEIGDLAVHGTRAYVANDANGFAVYDISDPTNPLLLDRRWDGGDYAHWLFYDGGSYAYVGSGWSDKVRIYDVSTLPLNAPTFYFTGAGVHDVYVAGARAYVLSVGKLDILDVSSPPNPLFRGSVALPVNQYGAEGEVRLQQDHAYLAMGDFGGHDGGLRVIDVSDDTHPTLVASYDLPGGAGKMYGRGVGLAVAGDRAYVAARGGLWVFDVSLPSAPVLVHQFPLPAQFINTMGAHVEVRDHLAYMTAYGVDLSPSVGGLAIYKVHEVPYPVAIDVKPGSFPNCFNLNGHGVIPVAILGGPHFDVFDIDTASLLFAGMEVRIRGNRGPLCAGEDVNGDPYTDLVCHFEDQPEYWIAGSDAAALTGELVGGGLIEGSDSVCVVP